MIGNLASEADLERFVIGLLEHRLTGQQGSLAQVTSDLAEVPRIVRGEVSSVGAITRGTGFTVGVVGTGDRTVTFDTAFPVAPVVVVSVGPAATNAQIKLHPSAPPATTGFRVAITDGAGGSTVNEPFTFVAVAV